MATQPILVCDGDSITRGLGLNVPWTSELPLLFSNKWAIHNIGVISETLATMLTNAPTAVDPFFTATATANVCVIWGGTNDFFFNGSLTAAQVYATLTSYIQGRQAAGFKVVVVPMLSRTALDTQMLAYNILINANTAGADAIVSLPNTLVGAGASSNTTYFQDGVHPTEFAATTIIAPDIAAQVNKFIGNTETLTPYYDQIAADTFNRANESPLNPTNWTIPTGLSGLKIVSDVAEGITLSVGNIELYTNAVWTNDQYSEAAIPTAGSSTFPGVLVRGSTAAQTGYILFLNNSTNLPSTLTAFIVKRIAGAQTVLATLSSVVANIGDVWRLDVVGTTLNAYRNGILIGTATDASLSSGTPGLFVQPATLANGTLANWVGGSITNTPVGTPTFSPVAGTYTGAQTVTISSTTAGVTIYYTLDGSTPTINSAVYSSPLTISSSLTLKAIAVTSDLNESAIGSAAYTINTSTGGVSWLLDQNSQFDVVKRHRGF